MEPKSACVSVSQDGASVGRVDGAPVGAADGWSVGAAVNFLRSAAVLELSLADLRSVSTQAMVYWPPGNTASIVTGYQVLVPARLATATSPVLYVSTKSGA